MNLGLSIFFFIYYFIFFTDHRENGVAEPLAQEEVSLRGSLVFSFPNVTWWQTVEVEICPDPLPQTQMEASQDRHWLTVPGSC